MKAAFLALYPAGSATSRFVAPPGSAGWGRAVKPDFVLPDGRWIDFKLHVSYRESHDVAWRPSALYASVRKYVDHPANQHQTLSIVYRHIHGSLDDVHFPILRGRAVLLADSTDFQRRITLVPVERLLPRIRASTAGWVADALRTL